MRKYLDDLLFVGGCLCLTVSAFGVDWRFGLFAAGVCLEVAAVLLALWGGDRR